jgi:hypothetical protein
MPRPLIPNLEVAIGDSQPRTPNSESQASALLRLKLLGAKPAAKVSGKEELPGKANYFIGNDPRKWRSNVPTYARVRYEDVYRGVDLVYYGNPSADGQLEFDFTVAPGGDPGAIRLRFGGPNHLHLAPNGDLVVTVANETLTFHKPLIYQMVDGDRQLAA